MAKIYHKFNFTGVSAPYVIAVLTEHSAPLAEVDRQVFTVFDNADTFDNLNPVMHRIRYYESSDGTTLGNLLVGASIDATIYNEPGIEIITFEVDAGRGAPHYDPVATSDTYSNPNLDGATYSLFVEGLGLVDPSYYDDITGGGFQWNTGRTWAGGEKGQIIKFLSVSTTPVSIVSKPFTDIVEFDADFTFGATHYNKFFRTDYAGTAGKVTFPAHATVTNLVKVKFSTHGGNQNYLTLKFDGSETVKFFNQDVNEIHLAKGEEIELSWKDGLCFIIDYKGNYALRGDVLASNSMKSFGPFLHAHIDTGVLDKADYPGLYDFVLNLPVGQACDLADWNTSATVNGKTKFPNRSRYGIDTLAEQFRVPHLANLGIRYLKASGSTDTERVNDVAGGYQDDMYLAHVHSVYPPDSNDQAGFGKTTTGNSAGEGTGITPYNTASSGGTETRMENYAQIPLIYL
jgi:hypothetical protein